MRCAFLFTRFTGTQKPGLPLQCRRSVSTVPPFHPSGCMDRARLSRVECARVAPSVKWPPQLRRGTEHQSQLDCG